MSTKLTFGGVGGGGAGVECGCAAASERVDTHSATTTAASLQFISPCPSENLVRENLTIGDLIAHAESLWPQASAELCSAWTGEAPVPTRAALPIRSCHQ